MTMTNEPEKFVTEVTNRTIVERLCVLHTSRAKIHGLRGRKRDDDLIAFMSGAACALHDVGREQDAAWVAQVNTLIFSTRGFSEAQRIVAAMEQREKMLALVRSKEVVDMPETEEKTDA